MPADQQCFQAALSILNFRILLNGFISNTNPFIHNIEKSPNILQQFCGVHTERFL